MHRYAILPRTKTHPPVHEVLQWHRKSPKPLVSFHLPNTLLTYILIPLEMSQHPQAQSMPPQSLEKSANPSRFLSLT